MVDDSPSTANTHSFGPTLWEVAQPKNHQFAARCVSGTTLKSLCPTRSRLRPLSVRLRRQPRRCTVSMKATLRLGG